MAHLVNDAEAGTVRLEGISSSINCHECPPLHTLDRFLWSLLGSVRTICVHRPWTRVSNMGVILDTRVYGPCLRASVHTTRYHGPWTRLVRSELPWTRPVLTGRVHACVHRHLLTTREHGPWRLPVNIRISQASTENMSHATQNFLGILRTKKYWNQFVFNGDLR